VKIYFTNARLSAWTHTFIESTFNYDSKVDRANLSPFATFSLKGLSIFKDINAPKVTIENFQTRAVIYRLIMGKLTLRNLNIDGFNINLSYDEITKFRYTKFLDNLNYYMSSFFKSRPLNNVFQINNIKADNGNLTLRVNQNLLFFKNILLEADIYKPSDFFDGTLFFYLNQKRSSSYTSVALNFRFDKNDNSFYITDLKFDGIPIAVEGKIILKERGFEADFLVNSSSQNLANILTSIFDNDSYIEFGEFLKDMNANVKINYL
ncbi:MAG: hypothetical protein LBC07_02530, partial [Elusimicrobiota bacterium]|nr:hypothetical protein [Elusimicrobiota bacterium]